MDESESKVGALLLWALMGTPEDELHKFRRQRIGRSSELRLEHLRRAQEILRSLAHAIRNDDDTRWEQVTAAWELLEQGPASDTARDDEPEPAESDAPDSPPAPKANPSSPPPVPARKPSPVPVMRASDVSASPSPWSAVRRPAAQGRPTWPESSPLQEEDETSLLPDTELGPRAAKPPAGATPLGETVTGAYVTTKPLPFAPAAQANEPESDGQVAAQPPGGSEPSAPPAEPSAPAAEPSAPAAQPSAPAAEPAPLGKTVTGAFVTAKALPFAPGAAAPTPGDKPLFEPPDPEDPESETIRLRAHVMPFSKRRRRAAAESAAPPPKSGDTVTATRPQPAGPATPGKTRSRAAGARPSDGAAPEAPGAPPPSLPTRTVARERLEQRAREDADDEPIDVSHLAKTDVSHLAETAEPPAVTRPVGHHGLPVLYDEDEDDDAQSTRVRPMLVAIKLGRYAQFCAECVVYGDRITEIRSKYGVGAELEHRKLDATWARRFTAQPDLRKQWDELFALKRAELLRGKKR